MATKKRWGGLPFRKNNGLRHTSRLSSSAYRHRIRFLWSIEKGDEMNPKPMKSGRTGRRGWQFRFTDPATHKRAKQTFWLSERREAERAFKEFLDEREAKRLGLPDRSGWQMPYEEIVTKF